MRWLFLLVVACGSDATPPPPPRPPPSKPAEPVGRNYRRAAMALTVKCDEGCGELAACRSLLDLEMHARGIAPQLAHVAALSRMCARHDLQGCWIGALIGVVDNKRTDIDTTNLAGRCTAGDEGACQVDLALAYFTGFGGPFEGPEPDEVVTSGLLRQMTNRASAMCRDGRIDACKSMVKNELMGCSEHLDCIATVAAVRRARKIDPAPLLLAWERVQRACGDGDADACDLIPGREVPRGALCDAGDFPRCAELGAQGDIAAAKRACDAGLGASCVPPRPASGTAASVVEELKQLIARCEQAHDAAACTAFAALRSPPACK